MCLAVPAEVVELRGGELALVKMGGVRKEISIALLDDVSIGDFVIVHVGYALNRLDRDEAAKTLAMLADMGELDEAP